MPLEPQFRSVYGLGMDDLVVMPFDRLGQHLADLGRPLYDVDGNVDEVMELAWAAIPQWR